MTPDQAIIDELTEAYLSFRDRFQGINDWSDEREHRTALSMTANYAKIRAAQIRQTNITWPIINPYPIQPLGPYYSIQGGEQK
ncbi:MAG: hypothetical protein A4E31_00125 [Methanomassiliicoccales archaeon PtaU1.Bin030]|nr:MAG: hypothetical protein A4E31_00125 [Methanomassiliicoccales archaeon PtaU1.Bin030]